jgi:hypothetical protein
MLFFFLSFFSSVKSENKRSEQILLRGRAWHHRRGELAEKRGKKEHQGKKCAHMCVNAKIIPVEIVP